MKKNIIAAAILFVATWLLAGARFSDNGDGTVKDLGTDLVWQKCNYGQNALSCAGTTGTRTWQQALDYCRNLSLAGRTWRLPSINELGSIVDYSAYNPSVNTAFFPSTGTSYYWSSSTSVDNNDFAWSIRFDYGNVMAVSKGSLYHVRCVADGP